VWSADCSKEKTAAQELMSAVTDLSNLSCACNRVIANGGAGGVDGMQVEELREWFAANHEQLRKQLMEETYRPQAVIKGVKIPKPNGGERQLGIRRYLLTVTLTLILH
jgi:RNA-directed DNA polymerase